VLICRRVLACKVIVIGRRIVVLAAVSRSWCLLTWPFRDRGSSHILHARTKLERRNRLV
jgi:hypothetical protein